MMSSKSVTGAFNLNIYLTFISLVVALILPVSRSCFLDFSSGEITNEVRIAGKPFCEFAVTSLHGHFAPS